MLGSQLIRISHDGSAEYKVEAKGKEVAVATAGDAASEILALHLARQN